jgi:hypothetical protein
MSVEDVIAEALTTSTPAPPNESTTCEWVIYPLLLAIGYARRDIVSRIADNNGQFPDYTILPDTPHTWFLEAKAWSVALEDRHAQQSLNYANQNGKRWVVLTNGKEWRLYDNRVQGVASDKLVASARLAVTTEISDFLRSIGRDSAATSELESYAIRTKLESVLGGQLIDEQSDVIKALHQVLRRNNGLGGLSKADVVKFFRSHARAQGLAGAVAYATPIQASSTESSDPNKSNSPATYSLQILKERSGDLVKGRKPVSVSFPGVMLS